MRGSSRAPDFSKQTVTDAGGHDATVGAGQITARQLWISLGAFIILTSALATQHVMWRDEVRAFSVAINARSWLDLVSSIHEEGHPILWYAILRAGYALTHSQLVLPVASLLIAWAAAYLVLRYAPFPFWVRLLVVFGAFLGHEFSVVSRNYGIGVLLMLLACVFFPVRHERPLRLGIALALLANTSVHASVTAVILGVVWLADVFNPAYRRQLLSPASIAALAVAIAGVVFALWSAAVPPDLTYAPSFSVVQASDIWRILRMDPGAALMGYKLSSITAAAELPWIRLGIDPGLASRLLVDLALLGVAWSLRHNRACLVAALLGVVSYELLFQLVYPGALRHEGIIAFLMISLVWIACAEPGRSESRVRDRSIALGLLPLLIVQTAALPVIARREIMHPASSSKAFASLIRVTPRFHNAILAGEPDYMMEPMPYYVRNQVFMPRQRRFDYRVYFDRGARRLLEMRLTDLVDVIDSLSCATGRPVLLTIGVLNLSSDSTGRAHLAYGAGISWDPAERARLLARGKLIASYNEATTDENYLVFEIPPLNSPGCHPPQQ